MLLPFLLFLIMEHWYNNISGRKVSAKRFFCCWDEKAAIFYLAKGKILIKIYVLATRMPRRLFRGTFQIFTQQDGKYDRSGGMLQLIFMALFIFIAILNNSFMVKKISTEFSIRSASLEILQKCLSNFKMPEWIIFCL